MTAHSTPEAQALARPGRLRGLDSGARELDDEPVEVRGESPAWLRGSLLLNGPALWELPQGRYVHWFDGLAMLHRVRIGADGARYRSRFLQSEDYRGSIAAGRPAFGGFATPDPTGLWQRLRHLGQPAMTDNGSVVMSRIGGQWVGQTETPLVTAFDPDTLETRGRLRFEDDEKLHFMSAHGITEADGTYWNVGVELGKQCAYKVFRVAPTERRREVIARIPVAKPGYLHALALTPEHVVLWEPALRAQPLKFLFTGNAYIDNFRWEPQGGSRIHRVSRRDGAVTTWTVPAMFGFHAVQAYEDGTATVLELCESDPAIIDSLRMDRMRSGEAAHVSMQLRRYRLEPGRGESTPEHIVDDVELPMVHGGWWTRRRARHAWCAGYGPDGHAPLMDCTVKVDLDAGVVSNTWQRPGAVQLEPLFVARPDSQTDEDGVLLVPTLADDDAGTVVAVLDPARMACLATLHLPQVVPFGFHAAWNSA